MISAHLKAFTQELEEAKTYQRLFFVALAYWLTGKLCLTYPFIPPTVSLIWLPAGIALAALLRWGSTMTIAIFIGTYALVAGTGFSNQASILTALGNVAGIFFAYWHLKKSKFKISFSQSTDILHFLLASILGSAISAMFDSFVLLDINVIDAPSAAFFTWWGGDLLGMLLITPFLLVLSKTQISKIIQQKKEFLAYILVFVFVHYLVFFSGITELRRSFAPMIVVLWAAVRFGGLGSTLTTICSSGVAVFATYQHIGPFFSNNFFESYTVLWVYTTILSVASILISTLQAERSVANIELKDAYDRVQKIASRLPGVIVQYRIFPNKKTKILYSSDAIFSILEVHHEDIANNFERLFEQIDPLDIKPYKAALQHAYANFSPYQIEFRFHRKNGDIRWLYIDAIPEAGDHGENLWHCFISDITDRKVAEEDLRIAAITFESLSCTFITDAKWRSISVNKAFTKITGYTAEELIGHFIPRYHCQKQDDAFYKTIGVALTENSFWQGELWSKRKNGELFPQLMTLTSIKNQFNEVTHYVGTFTDISVNKNYEDEIVNLAFYDPLTQLPNRRLLMDRLQKMIVMNQRDGGYSAIYFIDLDNFKTLNDTHGHDAGDLLLIEAATRLKACIRESDTVARLGGDEFVVVINHLGESSHEAMANADRLGEEIRTLLNEPYHITDFVHHGSGSIGVCLFQGTDVTVKDLFKRADTAMYEAKASGKNTIRFFDPAMQAVLVVRMMLESNLRNALSLNQFLLNYQIQVDAEGKILGAEALLRWKHPDRGFISPIEFIPLAEQTGLIVPIGLWVMDTACQQLEAWAKNSYTAHLSVAVNVSAKQFKQNDFVESIVNIVNQYNFDISRLKIELTESTILDNVDDTTAKMHQLKKIGVGFSMDDFGTGYSSLAYLQKLPLNQLKIDQSFVRDIGNDENDATIVRTIISLGNNLGLHVIAEGVETIEQRNFLINHECTAFQGYLFSKPLTIEDLNILLNNTDHSHPFLQHI